MGEIDYLSSQFVIYPFQYEKNRTENKFNLVEFALSFEMILFQLKISRFTEKNQFKVTLLQILAINFHTIKCTFKGNCGPFNEK